VKALLIPVKSLANAKQRLSPQFSIEQRAALAEALWQDFFSTLSEVRSADCIFVVSSEPRILARARELGWEAISETTQQSESDSVDFASRVCQAQGVTALLRLPVDLPLAEASDIDSLFARVPAAPGVVMVPSRDGDGTNALLRTPPALFPSHFGPGSFARHLDEARQCGAQIEIVRNPRLELDVDEPEDLRALALHPLRNSAARAWMLAHAAIPTPR
jgi:2-phospho-L-lactate/phosphoenolpyruvate guanylyltransferase